MKKTSLQRKKIGAGGTVFNIINYTFLAAIAFTTLYPFWYVLLKSILPFEEAIKAKFLIFPTGFTLDSYKYVLQTDRFTNSLMISVAVTVIGTVYQLFITAFSAYAFTKKDLPGRGILFNIIIVTMFFGGGLIPTYLLYQKLGFIDNPLVMVVPHAISTYNMIVMKSFFAGIPMEIEESARIDGASYFKIFFRIIMPLSLPSVATVSLFIAVSLWNSWYGPMLYLNKKKFWPMALVLRDILVKTDINSMGNEYTGDAMMLSDSVKMATVIVAITPILVVYPFVQKYFVKGVMVGPVKA